MALFSPYVLPYPLKKAISLHTQSQKLEQVQTSYQNKWKEASLFCRVCTRQKYFSDMATKTEVLTKYVMTFFICNCDYRFQMRYCVRSHNKSSTSLCTERISNKITKAINNTFAGLHKVHASGVQNISYMKSQN